MIVDVRLRDALIFDIQMLILAKQKSSLYCNFQTNLRIGIFGLPRKKYILYEAQRQNDVEYA